MFVVKGAEGHVEQKEQRMSGGSYDYAFGRVNDMAEKLSNDKSSLRRAFASHLRRVGTAMHAIEWVDSGDFGKGEDIDAIKEVLGVHWDKDEIEVLIQDGNDLLDELTDLLKKARRKV